MLHLTGEQQQQHFVLGQRVIYVCNSILEGKDLVNGDLGTVIGLCPTKVHAHLHRLGTVIVPPPFTWRRQYDTWQGHNSPYKLFVSITSFPLITARAITIHKSQGKTISGQVFLHVQYTKDARGLYVALSRAIDPSNITLVGQLPVQLLRSEIAKHFDTNEWLFAGPTLERSQTNTLERR